MQSKTLYSQGEHRWVAFARDPSKPEKVIDTNQYMIVNRDQAMLLDPGGIELFSSMLGCVVKEISVEHITHLFASHQDPDIISSLGLWDKALPEATLHSPWIWEGFIRHFGMDSIKYDPIEDSGEVCLYLDWKWNLSPLITCTRRAISLYMTKRQRS